MNAGTNEEETESTGGSLRTGLLSLPLESLTTGGGQPPAPFSTNPPSPLAPPVVLTATFCQALLFEEGIE